MPFNPDLNINRLKKLSVKQYLRHNLGHNNTCYST